MNARLTDRLWQSKILDNCINVTTYELHKNVIKIYNSAP